MSFVRTLAALAAGYAAAKGVEQFRRMGGMAGMQSAMAANPMLKAMQDQMDGMFGGAAATGPGAMPQGFQEVMGQWTGASRQMGDGAMAGLGGLMAAFGGATAAGSEQAAQMMDALSGNTASSATMEENAKLMIRAMLQAAKADGELDEDEKARILDHLGEVSDAERAFVEEELAKPIDLHGLAAETGERMKAQVYAMSAMAVKVDTASEASYLDGLAAALGLSDRARAQVHEAMGID